MLHLSRLIGQPVRDISADTIGVIDDLIAAVGTSHPPITGLVVRTGRRRIYLGWESVERMDAAGATILATRVNISRFRRRDDEILLKGDLLDKQIAKGAIALCCNLAFRQMVSIVAKQDKLSPADARTKAKTFLVPGLIMQPSGIFANVMAAEAGCTFVNAV